MLSAAYFEPHRCVLMCGSARTQLRDLVIAHVLRATPQHKGALDLRERFAREAAQAAKSRDFLVSERRDACSL
jgi:hypothetical protein